MRQAHRAAEVPGDHRETGGAAVHLVHLPHVGELPDSPGRLPLLRRPLLDCLVGRGRGVDLVEADWLRDRCLCRHELLGEIERHPGDELELVALHLAIDHGFEAGIRFDETPEVGLVEDEQLRRSDSFDAHRAGRAEEQGALSEEVAAADVGDVASRAVIGLPDRAEAALLDEEHRVRRVALADDDLALLGAQRLECVDEGVERVRVEIGERGRDAEEVAKPHAVDVALEMLLDLGVHLYDSAKDPLVELERPDVAARAHGRCPVAVLDQRDLAEGVSRAEASERTPPRPDRRV